MPGPQESVKTIFGKALEIQSAEERANYLDVACAGDASLRAEVEDLLGAIERAGNFLGGAPPADPPIGQPITEAPGTVVIGPYKLLQQIGEGGMGVVYMAKQTEPVERRVALKIIKPGMDSRRVIARFEAERHALAMMDHPSIARVLDAGTTETGRPYFVMELVKGVPITQYCDEHQLTPASGWSCSCRYATPSSTPTRRGLSTATSNRRTSWWPSTTSGRCPRSSTSAWPRRSSSG
jgi:serine/threonine protein kinase